jgi:pimeloyl-ACP methyl ester carboxylesterase
MNTRSESQTQLSSNLRATRWTLPCWRVPGTSIYSSIFFLDYANNVKLYPKFQEYFRSAQPPLLAVWGKFDPYFIPPGAEAFLRDNPNATVQFLETGHFALETHLEEVASAMRQFLQKTLHEGSQS